MRNNEYNNRFLENNFSQKFAPDEFNRGLVYQEENLKSENNNNYHKLKDANDTKKLLIIKLILAVFFCSIIALAVFVPSPPPKSTEKVISRLTKFNALEIIITDVDFINFRLDYVDENNYWKDFIVIINTADGRVDKRSIPEGQEKEICTTNYEPGELMTIEVFCNAQDNYGIEFNEAYNKTLIYKYVFK